MCNVTRSNPEIKCDTNEFLMKKRPAGIAAPFQCPLLHFYFPFLPVRYAVSEINKKKAARENHQKSKNIYLERILLFLVGERGIKETEREKERVRSHEDQKKSFTENTGIP